MAPWSQFWRHELGVLVGRDREAVAASLLAVLLNVTVAVRCARAAQDDEIRVCVDLWVLGPAYASGGPVLD